VLRRNRLYRAGVRNVRHRKRIVIDGTWRHRKRIVIDEGRKTVSMVICNYVFPRVGPYERCSCRAVAAAAAAATAAAGRGQQSSPCDWSRDIKYGYDAAAGPSGLGPSCPGLQVQQRRSQERPACTALDCAQTDARIPCVVLCCGSPSLVSWQGKRVDRLLIRLPCWHTDGLSMGSQLAACSYTRRGEDRGPRNSPRGCSPHGDESSAKWKECQRTHHSSSAVYHASGTFLGGRAPQTVRDSVG
jgi:hypothetical protein